MLFQQKLGSYLFSIVTQDFDLKMTIPLKKKINETLFGDPTTSKAARLFNYIFFSSILISISVLILESMLVINAKYSAELRYAEIFFTVFFTAEYFLRAWSYTAISPTGAKPTGPHYIFSFHGIIDFLATAPFYFQMIFPGLDLRFLRAIRMLRVLKLSRYNSALEDLYLAFSDERNSIVSAIYILAISILITSCFAYYAESGVQPEKFGSIPDAMWWSIITLTTVGYGDVSPITPLGKVIGVFTAFAGVCTVAILTGIVATSFTNQLTRKKVLFENHAREVIKSGGDENELENLRKGLNLTPQHANALIEKIKSEDY